MKAPIDAGRARTATGLPSPLRMLWITAALGVCFLGIQWGLRDAPLLWFAALRALLGGAALAIVAVWQRRRLPSSISAWGRTAILGLVNVSLAFAAMFAGVAGLATGVAAVLANAQPLLILLPAWWLFGERITARTGVALGVGFTGLLVVSVPGGGGSGALLSLIAAAAVTAGTLMVRGMAGIDVVVLSAAHFLIGGLVLAGAALVVEGPPAIDWTPRFMIVLGFLGLVATAATTLAWFVEAQRSPLASLTVWMFLIPVFGLLIGVVVLGERPTAWTWLGVALVLVSMWVALTKQGIPGSGPPGHLCAACPPDAPDEAHNGARTRSRR
ncbi:DMT family transporter [Arthrobacter sp. H14-L1]|uniref:DMT family transporter n=1 Tax=Arthrobacter sp. H14-L1 TaxID=2996697 RepID=UPI00226F8C64|nr:DMT family transporter [Arthrobacter sp. H14-L1]MCY0906217.1 DMT family transporter [Arthrobacter sp. H14-L1]